MHLIPLVRCQETKMTAAAGAAGVSVWLGFAVEPSDCTACVTAVVLQYYVHRFS